MINSLMTESSGKYLKIGKIVHVSLHQGLGWRAARSQELCENVKETWIQSFHWMLLYSSVSLIHVWDVYSNYNDNLVHRQKCTAKFCFCSRTLHQVTKDVCIRTRIIFSKQTQIQTSSPFWRRVVAFLAEIKEADRLSTLAVKLFCVLSRNSVLPSIIQSSLAPKKVQSKQGGRKKVQSGDEGDKNVQRIVS